MQHRSDFPNIKGRLLCPPRDRGHHRATLQLHALCGKLPARICPRSWGRRRPPSFPCIIPQPSGASGPDPALAPCQSDACKLRQFHFFFTI